MRDVVRERSVPIEWDHERFMGMALDEARIAYVSGEVPVGAVLVGEDGQVFGLAHNRPISACDPTAHAEVLALRAAAQAKGNYRLPGTLLYVTLEPCVMCLGAILHARVSVLVFGARDPKSGAAGGVVDLTNVPVFNHYVRTIPGVRETECAELLRRFFRERRSAGDGSGGGEVPKWP
jgi:tRNA(adenine34) deaminase